MYNNKKSNIKNFKNKSIKKCYLTFISSSGDSFLMSRTREDWSELAVAAGGVDLLPMTTRIRFCCSPHATMPTVTHSHYKTNTRELLVQRLMQLIITLTHNYSPGHKKQTRFRSNSLHREKSILTSTNILFQFIYFNFPTFVTV